MWQHRERRMGGPHFLVSLHMIIALSLGFWGCHVSPLKVEREDSTGLIHSRKPNFIVILTDDQGYGDLGCFGSETIKTPHIDQMAVEGLRFTSFMVASPNCTPSRAALLTGCYPKRIGMHQGVLKPYSQRGLNPKEETIADHLKKAGYSTACFGKWHLGHHKETLPTRHGFDEYFGIPYSNDMNHPDKPKGKRGGGILWTKPDQLWENQESTITQWHTPLMEGEEIVELPADQRTVTRRYTDRAIDFIKRNQEKPFFIYLPHSMPHVPLYVPKDVYDPNPLNAYKSVIEHIDAETGRLLNVLRDLGLDQNTYVIFTSDNGPWTYLSHHGGSAGPLKGHKSRTFEGGMRVPFVAWAPGRIPAGSVNHELVASIDLLPTIASLSQKGLFEGKKIDGFDISDLLLNPEKQSPRKEFLYYSSGGVLEGLRQGPWKILKRKKHRRKGTPKDHPIEYVHMLFNLDDDIGEKKNLFEEHPEMFERLLTRMESLDQVIEKNARPAWVVPKQKADSQSSL